MGESQTITKSRMDFTPTTKVVKRGFFFFVDQAYEDPEANNSAEFHFGQWNGVDCREKDIVVVKEKWGAEKAGGYTVTSFGAKSNGVTDCTQAFLHAWAAACGSVDSAIIYVPRGTYLLHPAVFEGDCRNSDIRLQIDGTLVAPADYRVLGKSNKWLSFEGVTGVSISGGTLDARGTSLWACKAASDDCPVGAMSLSFTNSKNIRINGLRSVDSQVFHMWINGCQNVHIQGVKIHAAGNSPNTDGIHVQLSRNVAIMDSTIKTGDDCISIGPGTNSLWIEDISCGPGHGISIGSLAKEKHEEGVQYVTVKNVVFTGTTNGLRINRGPGPATDLSKGSVS
ncbi:hypothetical protein L1049_020995 [Liquidambar formosana]|uniref:Polygalacturonase n=1 Tax=Liquidambar formosana TaxID=63359 RepID=A0AAP0SDX7_LIQFO